MRRWLAIAAMWAACGSIAGAQQAAPPQQGSDEGAIQKKVDAVFSDYDKLDSPGCSLGVIRDGKLIYTRGYGRGNLELSAPITAKTVFDIGSTSKQFTAASILLLEQQGKLNRDDDIRKFLPELPDYGKTITIRHLLHHTSGLRDYLTLMSLVGIDFHNVTGDDDALAIITRQKELNFAPGDEHLYSNSGYFLLAIIVQRASGKSLRAFAQEQIFGPLGMTNTHYHNDHAEIVPNRAAAYEPKEGGGYSIDISNFEQLGDGAVFTTVEDLLKWDQNFYDPKVGGAAFLEALQTRGRLNNGTQLDYAEGVVVGKYRGLSTVSHGGSWGGYRAELLRFPEQRFSVICQCNLGSTNPSRLSHQVAEAYLAEKMSPAEQRPAAASAAAAPGSSANSAAGGSRTNAVTVPAAELEAMAGVYRNPQNGGLRRIAVREGKLSIDSFGATSTDLLPLGNDKFEVSGAAGPSQITFEKANGRVTALVVNRQSDPPETERFARQEAFAPDAAQLAAYAGSFYSGELDVTYTLEAKDGSLWLRIPHSKPVELRPAVRDLFVGPFGIRLEFARDAQGRSAGFAVQAGRVRNIRFTRAM